ncbi:MAG TPA: type II toxin-antitoxin system RelE/ParE family toxin [Pyrinomonadaceae bacterium]|mgnify:CR=1 FL=1|nr:type II toxin-antitoxin system RelE/ParE family toxin [Pyrinomonadaceae bacterium]
MSKPVVPRVLAEDDLDTARDYYLENGGVDVAIDFLLEFDRAIAHISKFPGTGSPRYGLRPGLSGVRFWPMKKFPYLIFYIETEYKIDVWRVIHGSRDISAELFDPDSVP